MSNWNIKTFDFDFGFGFGGETGLDLNLVNSNVPNELSHVKKLLIDLYRGKNTLPEIINTFIFET